MEVRAGLPSAVRGSDISAIGDRGAGCADTWLVIAAGGSLLTDGLSTASRRSAGELVVAAFGGACSTGCDWIDPVDIYGAVHSETTGVPAELVGAGATMELAWATVTAKLAVAGTMEELGGRAKTAALVGVTTMAELTGVGATAKRWGPGTTTELSGTVARPSATDEPRKEVEAGGACAVPRNARMGVGESRSRPARRRWAVTSHMKTACFSAMATAR